MDALLISTTAPPDSDCLGITSDNPERLAVIHFDTEQSPYDHYWGIKRAMRRIGCRKFKLPPWLRSYYLADVPTPDRRAVVRRELERAAKSHNGIHCFAIDGIGDLCIDPNSPEEAFGLIAELHMLAIRYNCPAIPVLHENPGTEKTRGHLGSQLERKAETNLRLSKDQENVTNVFTEKSRGVHIAKKDGVFFEFDTARDFHVTCDPPEKKKGGASKSVDTDMIFGLLSKGPLTHGEWKRHCEPFCSASTYDRARRELLGDGRVIITAPGGYQAASLKHAIEAAARYAASYEAAAKTVTTKKTAKSAKSAKSTKSSKPELPGVTTVKTGVFAII